MLASYLFIYIFPFNKCTDANVSFLGRMFCSFLWLLYIYSVDSQSPEENTTKKHIVGADSPQIFASAWVHLSPLLRLACQRSLYERDFPENLVCRPYGPGFTGGRSAQQRGSLTFWETFEEIEVENIKKRHKV